MPTVILRLKEVLRRTGKGRSTIYREIAEGKFPKPVPLGIKSRGWLEEEIEAHIASRVAERDQRKAA